MQLQELKKLVEYDALNCLMATRHGGGWVLVAMPKDKEKYNGVNEHSLEKARGGLRVFKTLDAIWSLSKAELSSHSFLVC